MGKRKNTKTQNGRRRKISRDRNKTTTNPFKDGRGERRKTSLVSQAVMKQNRRKKDLSLSPSLSLSQNTKPLPKKTKTYKNKKPGIEGMRKPEKKQKNNKTALFLIDPRRRQYQTHQSRMAGLQDEEVAGAGGKASTAAAAADSGFSLRRATKKSRAGGEETEATTTTTSP